MTETAYQHPLMAAYWKQLDTRFPQVEAVFDDLMAEALAVLTREGIDAYLEAGRVIGKLGRGVEPRDACRMAMVRPITDDADIRDTLDHAIDATFA